MGDITYLALATGHWAYLASWREAFSRRVVGWHVSESLHTDLLLTAFNRAVAICQPPPICWCRLTAAASIPAKPSLPYSAVPRRLPAWAGPATPPDNALAESGWSTLKTELLPRGACFADLEEARLELAE